MEVNAPVVDEKEDFQGISIFRRRSNDLEHFMISNSDFIFVVSTALKNYYTCRYNIRSQNIAVIHNAVNPGNMQIDAAKVEKLKQQYQLYSFPIIGFAGSILYWHAIDVLIDAFDEVVKIHKQAMLLIVGDGQDVARLKEKVFKAGLRGKILFTGNIPPDEISSYIALMDITVLPGTKWYCSPMKLFEYAAQKKPVIAPNTDPVCEIMESKVDGLLIKSEKDSLYKALITLIENSKYAAKLAESFHDKVAARFTWEKNALNILSRFR